jgi:hypothetical protein
VTDGAGKAVWLVLPDPFPTRVFFDCGIVDGLREALPDRLELAFLLGEEDAAPWAAQAGDVPVRGREELLPQRVAPVERALRRADRWLDERIGFYPLALRLSLRQGFHRERMRPGHENWFLDPRRAGPLPRWDWIEWGMMRWHFGRGRHVPGRLLAAMREECSGLVLTNLQTHSAVPFLNAARRLDLPVVGYVSSWDHTVGKGAISPHATRYVVQNEVMRDDLVRYHGIDPGRVAITGWPQTDVFHRRRPREAYAVLVRGLGLDPARPLVVVAGNTPTNAPYEDRFVRRLLTWWTESGARDRFSLLLRPHPRDRRWRERFAVPAGVDGVAVQEPSYTDIEALATLLQHCDCVVANAGTILLDSLVNDRPAVCVLYDEGAPAGERWAELNVVGEHYRQLMESDAFLRAHRFEEVADGIERALARPDELVEERRRVAHEVVGEVDGRAAERVVEAVVDVVGGRVPAAPRSEPVAAPG